VISLLVQGRRREKGAFVDWIERIFHVSPDGGNGALEAVYYAVAAAVVGGFAFRRRLGRWARARRHRGR
jgi:hypothetical protein